MENDQLLEKETIEVFEDLAGLVNQLPDEKRSKAHKIMGMYAHDFKHTLGLVTSASAIIRREVDNNQEPMERADMLEIIENAAMGLNSHFNLWVDHFVNLIEVKE